MASWRYFGISPEKLSWAEASLLAILPNAPGSVYPGKNQQKLMNKRNFLLKKLYEQQVIDKTTYELSLLEELPQKPHELPQIAPHLVERIAQKITDNPSAQQLIMIYKIKLIKPYNNTITFINNLRFIMLAY